MAVFSEGFSLRVNNKVKMIGYIYRFNLLRRVSEFDCMSLAEIRSNLNALLESFIIVILWISVN